MQQRDTILQKKLRRFYTQLLFACPKIDDRITDAEDECEFSRAIKKFMSVKIISGVGWVEDFRLFPLLVYLDQEGEKEGWYYKKSHPFARASISAKYSFVLKNLLAEWLGIPIDMKKLRDIISIVGNEVFYDPKLESPYHFSLQKMEELQNAHKKLSRLYCALADIDLKNKGVMSSAFNFITDNDPAMETNDLDTNPVGLYTYHVNECF